MYLFDWFQSDAKKKKKRKSRLSFPISEIANGSVVNVLTYCL